jgi:glucosamine--fructose-6-phosphate aminotransferase (isomerizing)
MASWLEAELREQPAALRRFLERQRGFAQAFAAKLRESGVSYLLIASRGSSSNAARYAQYLLGGLNRVPVAFATPSLYTLYGAPPRLDGALVVGISQSGASPDVTAVIEEGRRQGRPTLALTNDPDSPLARAAADVLPLEAGEERAVAATKTYLNSLAAVALLCASLADDAPRLAQLDAVPDWVEEQIERSLAQADELDVYGDADGATVVARGINYGTAFEIALKIRELSGLLVEAYSTADLLHGPIAGIADGWPVIAIAPSGPAFESVREAVVAVRARGARVLAISDDPALLADADTPLPLARAVPDWLSPLVAVVPGQVAALRLARLRGSDVDRPHGLSKVTLTR